MAGWTLSLSLCAEWPELQHFDQLEEIAKDHIKDEEDEGDQDVHAGGN